MARERGELTDSRPRYSILITSRNEGRSLQRTVDRVLGRSAPGSFEIIIVDDASDEGSTDFVRDASYSAEPIRVVRNESRRGLIFSRARAADLARGDYLVFLDAHMAVGEDWLVKLERKLGEVGGRGIATPVVFSLDEKEWAVDRGEFVQAGCSIVSPVLDFDWVDPQLVDGRLCTCAIGGMAWMCSREWYTHLGGLDDEMFGWGGENIDIALRTWVAGGWCVVAEDVAVGHLFRNVARNAIDTAVYMMNKIRAAHSIFTKEVFERILENVKHVNGFVQAIQAVHDHPGTLAARKDHLEGIRERSDRWIIETFRLPVFEMPQFYFPSGAPRSKASLDRCRRRSGAHRPFVSVILTIRTNGSGDLLRSLVDRTAYRNRDGFVFVARQAESSFLEQEPFGDNPRWHAYSSSSSSDSDDFIPGRLGPVVSGADYFAILDERTVILDEHWIEKFLLLFERHPRLVLACPRTRWVGAGDNLEVKGTEFFDVVWDWSAPGFGRARRERPLAETPYQAFCCPETLLFIRRDPFLRLGGFDAAFSNASGMIQDLSIRAWLSGYEVYCHPGITVGRRAGEDIAERQPAVEGSPSTELNQLLPAVKYFKNTKRLRFCYERSLSADRLSRKSISRAIGKRDEFIRNAKFSDDWLFFKFGIEDPGPPVNPAQPPEERRCSRNRVVASTDEELS